LSGVKGGLLSGQLAGADLTGVKLPEPTANLYERLGSVSEISDSAKRLFLTLLAACLYSWLTIGTTKDVDLITNRASSPLPIIQTAIPIVGFYVVAPIILISVFFYFHFYLQKLWEELATLPAIFPDGKPLYQRADPWLFNDLVRAHFSILRENRPFLSYSQQFISIVLAWWLVPVTLLLFWGRYLRRHDMIWSPVLALIMTLSVVSAWRLYRMAKQTLRGEKKLALGKNLKRPRAYIIVGATIVLGASLTTLAGATIRGNPEGWIARAMRLVGYSAFLNLVDADVSTKPATWTGKREEELDLVKGADLSDKDLAYANAARAFLAKAQLRKSHLQGIDFSGADLRQADFSSVANLGRAERLAGGGLTLTMPKIGPGADLAGANLRGARLSHANLTGASLIRVDLTQADLSGAALAGSNLREARLYGADLTQANFYKADLGGAQMCVNGMFSKPLVFGLSETPDFAKLAVYNSVPITEIKYTNFSFTNGLLPDEIADCSDWEMAYYDSTMLEQLGLPADHNEALEQYRKSGSKQPFWSWQATWRQKDKATAAKTKLK
jgi:uncharacterized protein YjbI with pentapeptide repeats